MSQEESNYPMQCCVSIFVLCFALVLCLFMSGCGRYFEHWQPYFAQEFHRPKTRHYGPPTRMSKATPAQITTLVNPSNSRVH